VAEAEERTRERVKADLAEAEAEASTRERVKADLAEAEAEVVKSEGLIGRVRGRASVMWQGAQRRRPALKHFVAAYRRFTANNGNMFAAGLTYFSFLALFPLIFVAVSISGFVLSSRPDLVQKLDDAIVRNVPGSFGTVLQNIITTAINDRASVGLIGLLVLAWSGLGWVSNVRTAVDGVWGLGKVSRPFVKAKLSDALALAGMGIGVVLSFALTAVGTSLSGRVVDALGFGRTTVALLVVKVIGIGLSVAGDMVVFGWTLIQLSQATPSRRTTLRTSLLAAVGVEVLKLVGTYYLARIAKSPVSAALGAIVGVLIFMYLLARFLLYCAAWAAEAEPDLAQALGSIAPTSGTASDAGD